ncbi:hypothetical protein ACFFK0_15435 [Paenibacillus chartarius]|uniref:Uncharacterized protein n=1 Tax=Paenibacillus chartarius TaxID=747481 RepID=A0ABV6DMJ7_9BACL
MSKQEEERQAILARLQQLDRHGVWTDEKSRMEGYPPLTLHEARAKWAAMSDPKNQ